MIKIPDIKGRNVGVFGLGKAGKAAARALKASGANVFADDDSEAARANHEVTSWREWPWEEMTYMILSPGIAQSHACPEWAFARGVPVVGEVDVLYSAQPLALFIGITGTNGKSTTTALTAHILGSIADEGTVQVGGNLGTPALALEPLEEEGMYVLEMSSYQLDLTEAAQFRVAALLNLQPDHLERHGSMEQYIAAKERIFANQTEGDLAVIALDDEHTRELYRILKGASDASMLPVSTTEEIAEGIFVNEDGLLTIIETGEIIDLSELPTLRGRHNWQNAAVSVAICHSLGADSEDIKAGLETYPGLPHRMEEIGQIGGVRFVNDSKATNADAAQHALAAYSNIYWILGGKPKTDGIDSLQDYFPKVQHAFLIGEAEEAFARTLEGEVPYTKCGTLAMALEAAARLAYEEGEPDATVLLSPACASFDQWKSFEARGDAFRAGVQAMMTPEDSSRNIH